LCGWTAGASQRQQREKKLNILKNTGFADRISTAAAAKKARLEKFAPKATAVDPAFVDRQARRAAELEAVRAARAEQRAAALQARADAKAAVAAAKAAEELAVLEARRQERKERKTAQKVDANVRRQDRRDALQAYTRSSITA
jgi:hypothetical protein